MTAKRLPQPRNRIWAEVVIVLGLSLGASAVYSIVAIINRLTLEKPLSSQTATLNAPLSDRAIFDLVYQLLGIVFGLAPVALVIYLLWTVAQPHMQRLGLDFTRVGRDAGGGLALALIIGVPGIGLYLLGKSVGITVHVAATTLSDHWWTVPILFLSALRAGLVEEVIVIGYLFARLGDLGWRRWQIITASALLRGTYHLYQGIGPFLGNVAMGVLFGWLYSKYGRVLPLVIAHLLIDAATFIGYPWATATFPALF